MNKRQTGRSGVRILEGVRDFSRLQNAQNSSEVHPASCLMGTGGKAAEAHDHTAPRLRISAAVPPLLIYAFKACTETT